jgi:GT2 family glycosyltransferase
VPLEVQYRRWRARTEPDARALRRLAAAAQSWESHISVVLLLPSAPGEQAAIRATLLSLQAQPYPWWRAAAWADPDGSGPLEDARISWTPRQPGAHWATPLLEAARPEPGEFVAVIAPGCRVTRHGLVEVAEALRAAPDCDLAYTDWDDMDGRGRRHHPHLAYGWSPELLMGRDQVGGGLVLQRAALLEAAGGWSESDAPTEVYAELLRASAHLRDPRHLPVVALSRPAGSAHEAPAPVRRRCLEAWLRARDPGARVETGREPGVTDVRFDPGSLPEVAIVIPTRDRHELLRRCLESVATSTHPRRRVVIVDNGSREPGTLAYLGRLPHVVPHPGDFNFSAIVNRGVEATETPYVVLLNNDTVVRTPGWLEAMLEWCGRPGVGAVGARLVFADGRVQHEGIGIGIGRVAANLDLGWSAARACSAVTGACMMVRREAWDAVGGFDESLPVAFNDVDFCLRLWRAGWRVVMTPLAELQHDEGSSRGSLAPEDDYRRFCLRWGAEDRLRDAFLGPHVAWPRPLTLRIPRRRDQARASRSSA